MKAILCALMLAILTMSASHGLAALINHGTWTVDTNQNLAFLHLTQTVNISWNDMQTKLEPGGEFEGWRYATVPEITTLFEHAGIPNLGATTPANYTPVSDLIDFMGGPTGTEEISSFGLSREYITGFINVVHGQVHAVNWLGADVYTNSPSIGTAVPGDDGSNIGNDDYAFDDIGHWLVRPVPEPTMLALVGIGGLALIRRKRRGVH